MSRSTVVDAVQLTPFLGYTRVPMDAPGSSARAITRTSAKCTAQPCMHAQRAHVMDACLTRCCCRCRFVLYCMSKVEMLLSNGVEPVIVFDGGRLPMKADEEDGRRRCGLQGPLDCHLTRSNMP